MQEHSLRPFLLLNNGLGRESPPGLMEQRYSQGSSSTQADSRLTQDEQMKALKKLKKEIYNPVPKRISSRLCLYYRDEAAKILNEREREKEEDGKRCAVCLEDFEPKEMVMVTPCNHMFHEECIVPWVKAMGSAQFADLHSVTQLEEALQDPQTTTTTSLFYHPIIYLQWI